MFMVVSYDPLPDARIEKMLMTLKRIYPGSRIVFVGEAGGGPPALIDDMDEYIDRVYSACGLSGPRSFLLRHVLHATGSVSKCLRRVAGEERPDIVLAVNLEAMHVAAAALGETPVIVDYHEIWSIQLRWVRGGVLAPLYSVKRRIYEALEREAAGHVLIATTERAREYFAEKYGAARVYVAKNYPSAIEVPREVPELGCGVYTMTDIGGGILRRDKRVYRDSSAALPYLDRLYEETRRIRVILIGAGRGRGEYIVGVGRLRHMEMYRYITRSHYGLFLPRPTPVHRYSSPNRPYVYAAGGAVPIITDSVESVMEDMGRYVIPVSSSRYPESILDALRRAVSMDCGEINSLRRRLHRHVSENLVWENQVDEIRRAVEKAFSETPRR